MKLKLLCLNEELVEGEVFEHWLVEKNANEVCQKGTKVLNPRARCYLIGISILSFSLLVK